ncbi:hypothetical protein ABK040_004073 [Willaertia magna]
MNKSILIATVLAVLFFVAFAESRCYRTYYGLWKCYDAVDEQSDIRRNVAFSDIHSNREFADADIKFGKIFKKIGKIGLNLGKAYLRTQGIPLNDEQADKFWKKLWGVVKQVGKGAIKSYVNQNFDAEADFKLGKLLKKVGKVGLKLGKAYLRTQGLPLEDNQEVTAPRRISPRRRFSAKRRLIRRRVNVESDKFWKKLFKVVGQIGKGAIKSYVNQNFDAEADRLIRIGCC